MSQSPPLTERLLLPECATAFNQVLHKNNDQEEHVILNNCPFAVIVWLFVIVPMFLDMSVGAG